MKSNPNYQLQNGDGIIVYAIEEGDISFTSLLCSGIDLKPGQNLVGFACPGENYSAFDLLADLGSENVISIQRFSVEKGAFETAGFVNGNPTGIDFSIVPGEGYFIFMNQEVLDFNY